MPNTIIEMKFGPESGEFLITIDYSVHACFNHLV